LKSRWERDLAPFWRNKSADSIGASDVVAYRAARLQTLTRRGKPPSPATLNREIASLRRVLAWAAEQQLLSAHPLAHVGLLPERNVRRTHLRGEAELGRLVEACEGDVSLRAAILLMADSGLRRLEALKLRWDEIAEVHGRRVVELCGARTKNGEPRRVLLTKRAWEALSALQGASPWCFPARKGNGPCCPRWVARKLDRAVAKSGLHAAPGERITIHTLRHSFAYMWRVQHGVPEAAVQRQGGWRTRSAFNRYGISDDQELEAAIRVVDSSLRAVRRGPHRATVNAKSKRATVLKS
jgi:integrase